MWTKRFHKPVPLRATIETILDDRHCAECGYNLKGLESSGLCPECGAPCSAGVSARVEDGRVIDDGDIGQTPVSYLLPLAGAVLACGLAGMVLAWFVFILLFKSAEPAQVRIALAGATAWTIGVLILLRGRPTPAAAESLPNAGDAPLALRLIVAVTQPAWVAAVALAHLELTGVAWAGWGKYAALAIACVGLPGVPVLVSYTAQWAMCQTLAEWLRNGAWALGIGAAVAAPIRALAAFKFTWVIILYFPEAVGWLLWFAGLIGTSLLTLSLVVDLNWAVINARERIARDRRLLERRRRHEQAVMERVPVGATATEATGPLPTPIVEEGPAEPPSSLVPPPQFSKNEIRIEPAKDVQPYRLEDSTPPGDDSAGT